MFTRFQGRFYPYPGAFLPALRVVFIRYQGRFYPLPGAFYPYPEAFLPVSRSLSPYPDPCPCNQIPVPVSRIWPLGAMVGRKILLRVVGAFCRPGQPIPGTFLLTLETRLEARPSSFILYIAFMCIEAILCVSETPLERSALQKLCKSAVQMCRDL